jgi:hypothetical protein
MKLRPHFCIQRLAPAALPQAFMLLSALLCALMWQVPVSTLADSPADQPVPVPVARIEGDDISVRGQMNLERETGHTFAELFSGSEVIVRSRQARIELAGGGEVGICGPAKFSLLRSGATLTLALDFGRIHARLNQAQALTIYTPLAVATPVPISPGAGELHLGLEQTGQMCLYAARGAVRVQPQFGDAAVLVPQNMEASFSEGHLEAVSAAPSTCRCNALEAFAVPSALAVRTEPSPPAAVDDHTQPGAEIKLNSSGPLVEPAPAAQQLLPEEPVWTVIMPPLRFDAAATLAAPPKPETILLLREVRVQSGSVFHGTVEASVIPLQAIAAKVQPDDSATKPSQSTEKKSTFGTRVRNFFRRLFGGKPKE